jgi:uncharacterized protein (DUF302 family)
MNGEPAVTAYVIPEPFDRALRLLRDVLGNNELSIAGEVDVSSRIKRELNIGFGPCRILLVDSPCLLLEACTLDRAAAAFVPLHLVLCGRGPQTLVHWMNPATLGGVRLPAGAAAPLLKLHTLLARSVERVAMRRDLYQMA